MTRAWIFLIGAVLSVRCLAQPPALIGYYAGDGNDLYDREIGKLTHVIWCFGHLQGDSLSIGGKAQNKVIRQMIGFKRMYPELKVLVSMGGWGGCATCSEVFSREDGRRDFAASVLWVLKQNLFDGIDLDWEYPAVQGPPGHAFAPEDQHNFTLLVKELRRVLGPQYEISFAAGGTDECLTKGFEWDSVMTYVDRVHIMSYDLVHGYSTATGHHTPLFDSKGQASSADHAVRTLLARGVPLKKIVIGSAFYARIFKEVAAQDHGLYKPGQFDHTIPFSAMDTTITEAKGWTWYRDEKAKAPYAYNPGTREFLTCDDATSVIMKARYVNEMGLGGIMFWQLVDDERKGGLLDAMHRALRTP
jgi:chitinase